MSSVAFIIIRVAPAGRTLLLYFVFQINKQTNKQTLLSAVAYNFNLIMDFQHFIEIGERVKLEGPQLHAFVEKELDKMIIKEEAAAAREDRAAERVVLKEENERLALKESEERRMQHENDMAAMHLEGHRALNMKTA